MRRATHISLGPSIKGLLIHIQFHLSGKKAIILHFKKKSAPLENNDYRPVALNYYNEMSGKANGGEVEVKHKGTARSVSVCLQRQSGNGQCFINNNTLYLATS